MPSTPLQRDHNHRPQNVIKRAYHNILRRVTGKDPKGRKSFGMPVGFTRDEFLAWTLTETNFWKLYYRWVKSGYQREFAPSIDRLDDYQGYVPGNVRWIVWRENNGKPRPRRCTKPLTAFGRTQSAYQWSKEFKIDRSTLRGRLKTMTPEAALLTPVNKNLCRGPRRPSLSKAA